MNAKVGLLRLPLAGDHYTFCSDLYGHRVHVPGLGYDESFIAAVKEGYDEGALHDNGHLVVVKATDKLAFLVTVRVEDDTLIPEAKLAELSARHGVSVRPMAHSCGDSTPPYQLITAQLDRIEQFGCAYDLTADIAAAEVGARAAIE